jgi:hypothetical protein
VSSRRRAAALPFTLLEVLIAITVLMLVVAVMVGFGREMARTWQKLQSEHARFRALLVLDRTVDGLLSQVVPFQWPNDDGEAVPFFVGASDYLRCVCLHPVTQPSEGALRCVELFVEDGQLLASYTDRPYRDPPQGDEQVHLSVLAEGVDRIEFAYADWNGDESGDWGRQLIWVSEWDPERKELPLAIMMTVLAEDGSVHSWLRRVAASGYRERWGKWEPAKKTE